MLAGSELRGVLNIESPLPNCFDEGDERLLQGLADLAIIALQNAQAYEREKRLAAEARAINQISKEITSQLDQDYVFNLILEKALELTSSMTGTLELYDPQWHDLRLVAERGVVEERKHQRLSLDQGVVGYVARHKEICNVDPSQSPWKEVYVLSIPGTRSELAVPMLARNELCGVLNVESPFPNNFKENDERSLQALAQLAVVALQNAERYIKAETAAKLSNLLYQAGQELGKITEFSELDQVYDVLMNVAQKYCDGRVVISQYKDDTREFEVIRTTQYQDHLPFPKKNLIGQMIRERGAILIYDIHNPPEDLVLIKLSDPKVRSFVAIAVEFKERYYGNIEISHQEVGHFVDEDVRFVRGLTQQLASTIYRLETVKARQEFEQISSVGHSTFELTHRLANDLALVQFYTSDIEWRMEKLGITDTFIDEKLNDIVASVQGVLTFSDKLKRALVNPVEEEPVLMSPQELFKEALMMPSIPPNIQIHLEIDQGVRPVLIIPSQVSDILRNLVANAIDALPQGGQVTLLARNSGHFVALEVTDTGSGILPQYQSKIFDLSFTTKGSSGFGLWSARRNALRNHGDLRVESELGRTTFTLLLPRTDGDCLK